ncbi:MAG: 1,6-anhydro-N-acetylmuramyl-L-alanine amidase AmpD [Cytophagales bacterium]|nr:1,6-anhydro-N-acetylmuramyl-L-alanine amidase AmpD [Cytophagales bacterium]
MTILWDAGWYRFARRLPSPNFGERPADTKIDLVVIHSISLPPQQYGGGYIQQLFTNQLDWSAHPYFESIRDQTVSSHFLIERTGTLWQFVSCYDRAWHAGKSSYICKNGQVKNNCNDFSIGIELEGVPGETFTDAQYESLASLNAALTQAYSEVDFVGHEHIAPGRKDDPGSGFDWSRLRRGLG